MFKQDNKVGIVCCSNGVNPSDKLLVEKLEMRLWDMGLVPVLSDFIFARDDVFSGTAQERAAALMDMYCNSEIKGIFDISGGDIANEVLPYLDFDVIARADKMYWGYSDNSTIVNAIYAKTGKASVLYQIKNLVHEHGTLQCYRFMSDCMGQGDEKNGLFDVNYAMVQGEFMEGIVVGGNARCFLKLAGTEYFPDLTDKILLLEAWSGGEAQLTTFLAQLHQLGTFKRVKGVILGTFTQLDKEKGTGRALEILQRFIGVDMPVAVTREIGHGHDAKAVKIGEYLKIE